MIGERVGAIKLLKGNYDLSLEEAKVIVGFFSVGIPLLFAWTGMRH